MLVDQFELRHLRPSQFSSTEVTRTIKQIVQPTKTATVQKWREAIASLVVSRRPDLADGLKVVVKATPSEFNPLSSLTIGEISVCYEAILAEKNSASRRNSGQFFTPDDVAQFMAKQSEGFPEGTWLDPACGVGNLAWHLASCQSDPGKFVANKLILIDKDPVALDSAVALIGSAFLAEGDLDGLDKLRNRAKTRDFLSDRPLPAFDYSILNPPYARTALKPKFITAPTRDLFAYFLERVSNNARGMIAVTPASYLNGPKFTSLKHVLESRFSGGRVFVFDNVPDTLFRGYKFGSNNTSKTNFVRATITVVRPSDREWSITPILRWKSSSRNRMFDEIEERLSNLYKGPAGEWAKVPKSFTDRWLSLMEETTTVGDLTVPFETDYRLTVASTPRYFTSATFRDLARRSKVILHFENKEQQERASIVLNSSLPYIWWRILDGGVSLPRRVLMSTPIPARVEPNADLVKEIQDSESDHITTKLNAGTLNENVKHPPGLVRRLNQLVFGDDNLDFSEFYSPDMFA